MRGVANQVNLLFNVTPRYLTDGFHAIGSLLKVSGCGVGLRRRLNKTLSLFDRLIINYYQLLISSSSCTRQIMNLSGFEDVQILLLGCEIQSKWRYRPRRGLCLCAVTAVCWMCRC